MIKAKDVDVFEPKLCIAVCHRILVTYGVIHVCIHPRGHTGPHTCNCGATWEEVKDE